MISEQTRRHESRFRAGFRQIRNDYFSGSKEGPINDKDQEQSQVTYEALNYNSQCRPTNHDGRFQYLAEQEDDYQQHKLVSVHPPQRELYAEEDAQGRYIIKKEKYIDSCAVASDQRYHSTVPYNGSMYEDQRREMDRRQRQPPVQLSSVGVPEIKFRREVITDALMTKEDVRRSNGYYSSHDGIIQYPSSIQKTGRIPASEDIKQHQIQPGQYISDGHFSDYGEYDSYGQQIRHVKTVNSVDDYSENRRRSSGYNESKNDYATIRTSKNNFNTLLQQPQYYNPASKQELEYEQIGQRVKESSATEVLPSAFSKKLLPVAGKAEQKKGEKRLSFQFSGNLRL